MTKLNPLSTFTQNALLLQRLLGSNRQLLNRTTERLLTGLRINRAADDPTGITLARRTQTQLISNRQAADNIQHALVLADTAYASIQGIIGNLQRMRDLILESLNDTANATDRARIQQEINQLIQSIDYLSQQSIFNTRRLLDGSLSRFVLPMAATGDIVHNAQLRDIHGHALNFLTAAPVVNPNASAFDLVQFRMFDNGRGGVGLQISTASGGVVMTYEDITTAPTSISIHAGGAMTTFHTALFASEGGTPLSGPLTAAELDQPLGLLVASGRLNPVNYGSLDLTLGGTRFSGVINISSTTTLNQVLSALNGIAGVSASYDPSTGLFALSYSNTRQVTATNTTTYDIAGAATGVGGPFSSFALMPAPAQGPAYRDITPFLPSPGSFGNNSPAPFFPAYPTALDTSLDFSGSSADILNFFGFLNSYANQFTVTDYAVSFYGDAVATGNPNEYVNRTRAVITSITGQQTIAGTNSTGLTRADLNRSLQELSTPYVTLSSGATTLPNYLSGGPLTIDFGSNGVFSYNFDPDTDTIQSVIDAINAYGAALNAADPTANVTASFNPLTGQIILTNDPPDSSALGYGIGEDTEIENSQIKIAFGSKSQDIVTINNPSDLTIEELVTEINNQLNRSMGTTGVQIASFSYNDLDDRLRFDLSKYTSPTAYGNRVVFNLSGATGPDGEPNGYDIADFFNLIPENMTAADFNAAGGIVSASGMSGIVTSLADVDLSPDTNPFDPREITENIYLNYSLVQLSAVVPGTPNNAITFGSNATSAALQDLFNIPNMASTGSLLANSSSSVSDIDNGSLFSGLNITDPSALTFSQMLQAPVPALQNFNGLLGQTLRIDGVDVITITHSTTLNDIITAINALPTNNNKTYQAFFNDSTGQLEITTTDIEATSAPSTPVAANPGQASPTLNGNELTLDSDAYTFSAGGVPSNYTPFSTTQPPAPYVFTDPSPPDDISSIVFGGSTNLASVLGLSNAPNASVSGPTPLLTEYQATATFLSGTLYQLSAEKRVTYGATSATTSNAAVGNPTSGGSGGGAGYVLDPSSLPSDGLVAEVAIFPAIQGRYEDRGIVFQIGGEEGNTLRFHINELTLETLKIENLLTYRPGDNDAMARLHGSNALRTVDRALEYAFDVLNQVGVYQRSLATHLEYLEAKQIHMTQHLSDLQDADVGEEATQLTRAQITAQVGAALIAQNAADTSSLYSVLFDLDNRFKGF